MGPPALLVTVTAETQAKCGRGKRAGAYRKGGCSFLEDMDLGNGRDLGAASNMVRKLGVLKDWVGME